MAKGCGKQTVTPAAQAKRDSGYRQRFAIGTTQQPASPKLVKK